MASSEMVKITGTIVRARPIAATTAFNLKRKPNVACAHDASTISAKKPSTTDGMPAKSSIAGFTTSRTALGAYSAMNMAQPIPSGTLISIASSVTLSDPTKSGMTLNLAGSPTGCQMKTGSS